MSGRIAFLTINRDMDLLAEIDLDIVGFRGIYCKDYINYRCSFQATVFLRIYSTNISNFEMSVIKMCKISSTIEKLRNMLDSPSCKAHMQHLI